MVLTVIACYVTDILQKLNLNFVTDENNIVSREDKDHDFYLKFFLWQARTNFGNSVTFAALMDYLYQNNRR